MSDDMVAEVEEIEEVDTEGKVTFSPDRPMSPSSAISILKDAELWKWQKENPQPPIKATSFGSALHCLLLEPERFEEKFYVPENGPINPKTNDYFGRDSKTYIAWFEGAKEAAAGRLVISPKEFKELQIMQKMHRVTVEQICRRGGEGKPIERERRVEWVDRVTGQPCKGFIDAMCGNVIIDIKTASALDDSTVFNKIKEGYFLQAGVYAEAVKMLDDLERVKVFLLFIRSKAPYSLRIVEIAEDDLERGVLEFRRAIKIYRTCIENKRFTCYRGFEKMGLPRWKQMEIDAANGRG